MSSRFQSLQTQARGHGLDLSFPHVLRVRPIVYSEAVSQRMLDPACPPLGDWGRNPTKSVLVVNNGPIDNSITSI